MPSGLSVSLPLTVSNVFGAYGLNTTYAQLATQNLKMLMLTVPGERIMDPGFGVGLRTFLHEFNSATTYREIMSETQKQVNTYLPYIRVDDMHFEIPELSPHGLSLSLFFTIVPVQMQQVLQITVDNG